MKKALVLGGTGFIGAHLVNSLLQLGWDVTSFSRSKGGNPSCKYLVGDFEKFKFTSAFLNSFDHVFHLISTTLPNSSNLKMTYDLDSNLLSTVSFLENMAVSNCGNITFISSGGTVYGIPESLPIDENHKNYPICSYGIQKLAIEKYLYLFSRIHKINATVLRVSNPYGLGQNINSGQGVVMTFINKMLNNQCLEIWGDGNVIRDYLYIADLISAIIKSTNLSSGFNLFNVGSGKGYSLNEIIAELEILLEKKADRVYLAARQVDVPINVLDIKAFRMAADWQPKFSLREGLKNVLDKISQ